jgi:hypothetical protein
MAGLLEISRNGPAYGTQTDESNRFHFSTSSLIKKIIGARRARTAETQISPNIETAQFHRS